MSTTNQWFVYIVKCANGNFYTGCTNNLSQRIKTHNAGKGSKYTRSHRPVRLVYSELTPDRSAATKLELTIKKMSRQQKEELIEGSNKAFY